MSSDITARAQIRDAALRLFADHGPDAVSVRQVAEAAEVSTALVLYHYGSKGGLEEAVESHAAAAFDDLLEIDNAEGLAQMMVAEGDGMSVAEAFASNFGADSPLPAYLRRLLLSGSPAGERLFGRWYDATLVMLRAMREAGYAAPTEDVEVRAAFLLASDLALVVLRDPIRAALGTDPLSGDGLARWAREATAVYRDGILTPMPGAPGPDPDSQKGTPRS